MIPWFRFLFMVLGDETLCGDTQPRRENLLKGHDGRQRSPGHGHAADASTLVEVDVIETIYLLSLMAYPDHRYQVRPIAKKETRLE